MNKLPLAVKLCLWSYDTDKVDISSLDDRFRIVLNILNRGSRQAVEWLWQNFTEEEIKTVINASIASEWNKKSLSFWSQLYNAAPEKNSRLKHQCLPSVLFQPHSPMCICNLPIV